MGVRKKKSDYMNILFDSCHLYNLEFFLPAPMIITFLNNWVWYYLLNYKKNKKIFLCRVETTKKKCALLYQI